MLFERNPGVVDRDVVASVEALINGYARERSGRNAPSVGPPAERGLFMSNVDASASGG